MKRDGEMKISVLGHKRIPSREGGVAIGVEEYLADDVEKHQVTCYNCGDITFVAKNMTGQD